MSDELVHSGLISYMDENYLTAVDQFSKSLERDPNNFKALIYKACALIKLGEYPAALLCLNNADNLNPNCYDVLYNRARAYLLLGDLKSSQTDLVSLGNIKGLSDEQKENISHISNKLG